MSFLLAVLFLLGAPVVLGFSLVPRKTVLQPNVQLRLFQEDGFWNYSTMLLREDLGVLIVGAREAIYALDVGDISVKKSAVRWHVKPQKQTECTYKGKHMDVECRNYIRTLHKINATSMYVCGTNAFSPTCDYMTYTDGQLKLMQEQEEGKGKCPFDPFQRYSSVMVGADLYTATSLNFLGSEPAVLRSSSTVLRSDFKSSWLNEPQFIYMDLVPESEESPDGDDDKVYLFFSEVAVEYDYDSKLMVSRVARVCKGDMGGQRTLQRKWTSFLKARLDCPVPELSLPYVVQDVFLLRRPNWRESLFYAVFTPQSGSTDLSAVCAYSMAAIGRAFGGKYKTPVDVESSHVKWVTYSGEVPVPRPGACVDDGARRLGMRSSRNLPDSTLQFVRDRPLMDEAVHPVTGGPLLLKRGTLLTRVVVDSVLALDGHRHAVMFAATEDGFIQKAVNYDKEMFVIEEVQLFQTPEPIKTLRLSTGRGLLYAGSDAGAVQMPLSDCGRHSSCQDCVLARDPYCAWSLSASACSRAARAESGPDTTMIQSLRDGNASLCPDPASPRPEDISLVAGTNVRLGCRSDSNLAQVRWLLDGKPLQASEPKFYRHPDGILVLSVSAADAGDYACELLERAGGGEYRRTQAVYRLRPGPDAGQEPAEGKGPTGPPTLRPDAPLPQAAAGHVTALQASVAVLLVLLLAVLLWLGCRKRGGLRAWGQRRDCGGPPDAAAPLQEKRPEPSMSYNNNHVSFSRNGGCRVPSMAISSVVDESEI
ncbi:semaphorin-4E [Denticeps clupeoides]|uniref:Semaphorin-4E n=1 Tax=Denticeps clupeoides TaxID=299321 RepID=A0AAY4EB74_9TELE|nr:semaphorin-4E-like [Denticeps clupeoides]XP_028817603.1 semaphorin-4E-like [Denticeps clupeoides]